MKKNHVPSLDDIVFQGRNQEYGAYVLRQKNSKYVGIGIVISLILLSGGLCYPVLASLFHKGGLINENISIESIILAPPTNEAPPPPPPPPPPV